MTQIKLPLPLKAKPVKLYEVKPIFDRNGNLKKIIVGSGAKGDFINFKTKQSTIGNLLALPE